MENVLERMFLLIFFFSAFIVSQTALSNSTIFSTCHNELFDIFFEHKLCDQSGKYNLECDRNLYSYIELDECYGKGHTAVRPSLFTKRDYNCNCM